MIGSLIDNGVWIPVRDGDPRARGLYYRHYSRRRYRNGRRPAKIVGPGSYKQLLTPGADALFVWRKFRPMNDQSGINCAVFRNESDYLSSDLIREADAIAWMTWPDEARHYTYVNPAKIKSTNPGYCFIQAGWQRCGVTPGGLVVLERLRP